MNGALKMAEVTLTHAEKTRFAGYSDDQVRMVLEQIATTANLMDGICRSEGEKAGMHESANVFYSLAHMASGIGALADLPTGGEVVGSFEDWFLGPLFNRKANVGKQTDGEAVHHG